MSAVFWKEIYPLVKEIDRLLAINAQMLAALKWIAERKGCFNRDQFEHCQNTVEDMKELALAAIRGAEAE